MDINELSELLHCSVDGLFDGVFKCVGIERFPGGNSSRSWLKTFSFELGICPRGSLTAIIQC